MAQGVITLGEMRAKGMIMLARFWFLGPDRATLIREQVSFEVETTRN